MVEDDFSLTFLLDSTMLFPSFKIRFPSFKLDFVCDIKVRGFEVEILLVAVSGENLLKCLLSAV